MSYNAREIPAPPRAIFEVLTDPSTYPDWLIGASEIRDVDDEWPAVGSRFHHLVGFKPLVLADHTEILEVEPDVRLTLGVRARPFVSAVAEFRIIGHGQYSVVSVQEEPALRLIGNLVRPLMDPVVHTRNHRSLRRLEHVVLDRHSPPRSAP